MAPLQQLCVRPNLHSRFRSLQYRGLIGVSAQYAYDTEAGMTLQCPGVGGRGRSPLILNEYDDFNMCQSSRVGIGIGI